MSGRPEHNIGVDPVLAQKPVVILSVTGVLSITLDVDDMSTDKIDECRPNACSPIPSQEAVAVIGPNGEG